MFELALNSMLTLFVFLIVGFVYHRRGILTNEMNTMLSVILLNITFPSLVISSLAIEMESNVTQKVFLAIGVGYIYHFIVYIFAFLVFKYLLKTSINKNIWIFGLVFANTGYLGFPLISAIYGEIGLFYAVLMNVSFNTLVLTIGVLIMCSDKRSQINLKEVFMSPAFISIFIGLLIFTFKIPLPIFIKDGLSGLGSMTSPIAMMVVGASLANTSVSKAITDKRLYFFSFAKLIVVPIVIFIIMNIFIDDKLILQTIVILSSTPTAAITVILAQKYSRDVILSSEVIFLTTFLSIITIPIVAELMDKIL